MALPNDSNESPEDAPPDAWAEADRAYRAKWADDAEPPPDGYVPTRATPKVVNDAYRDGMTAAGPYLGLGAQIGGSMALFCGLGYLVDRWLGSSPWGILVGAMLGMAGIVALLVRLSNETGKKRP